LKNLSSKSSDCSATIPGSMVGSFDSSVSPSASNTDRGSVSRT
jgi:hypothetical protein